MKTVTLSDRVAVLATIDPDVTTASTVTSDWVSMVRFTTIMAIINCNAEELDVDGGFTHVRLSVTVATATSDLAAIIVGGDPRHGLASDNDLATVDEIVR